MAAEARRLMGRPQVRPEQIGQLTFGFDVRKSYPTRPALGAAEQRVLPIQPTIQAAFESWRSTEDGTRVVDTMLDRCLSLARQHPARIGMKSVAEWTRDHLKVEINNNYVSLIARELIERAPTLKDFIQLRERRAT